MREQRNTVDVDQPAGQTRRFNPARSVSAFVNHVAMVILRLVFTGFSYWTYRPAPPSLHDP